MNKKVIIGLVICLIIISCLAFMLLGGKSKKAENTTNQTAQNSSSQDSASESGETKLVTVKACDVLTDPIAKTILGPEAQTGSAPSDDVSSDDLTVSNCTYFKAPTSGSVMDIAKNKASISLLVRSPKSQTGAESNKAYFDVNTSGLQDVPGYGDKAMWDTNLHNLTILKGSNIYIISHYIGTKPSSGTLEMAMQVADAIKANLN